MSNEIKINGNQEKALYTRAFITWDAAVEVVCRLAAMHGHEGVFSTYDADRLTQAVAALRKAPATNPASGMTPNIWAEHQDDKTKRY